MKEKKTEILQLISQAPKEISKSKTKSNVQEVTMPMILKKAVKTPQSVKDNKHQKNSESKHLTLKEGADEKKISALPSTVTIEAQQIVSGAIKKTKRASQQDNQNYKIKEFAINENSSTKGKRQAIPKNPKKKTVKVFQIYYKNEQRPALDPAFEPYNNEGDKSPLLEFNVFRKLKASNLTNGADYWGAVSWRFKQKTGLSGDKLIEIINKNPGYDVYYCNPYPELEGLYENLWIQGETAHPNFMILCRDFFEAAELDSRALKEFVHPKLFAASNYFIANSTFWNKYIDFVEQSISKAMAKLPNTSKALILSSAADPKKLHAGATYLPFIVERLFIYFMTRQAQGMKAYKYDVESGKARLSTHTLLLSQMKKIICETRSEWMAKCWLNYRSLYFVQANGREWFNKYKSIIINGSIHIAN